MNEKGIENFWYEKGRLAERTALREKVEKEFEQRSVDKAEILKNNGYGNPPILFEKSEIIKILSDLLNQ